MKLKARLALLLATSGFALLATKPAAAQSAPPVTPEVAPAVHPLKPNELRLYAVGYSHLDTQWRWSYPQVISEFLRNTLDDNFKLFDQYPDYIFNFTGSNRYMMFKEYYPNQYPTLKKYIAQGRWFPGGSSVEEGDVNMPDGEAIIRQVLYGNEFFRKEFGKQSCEYMLPDCFGFQASLPSILAHCGLKGFSTQKLTWGSAVGVPFNVGVWTGPDGREIIAALNPGAYDAKLTNDMSQTWKARLEEDVKKDHVGVDYRYYGAGDRGGSVGANSLKWLEKSVNGTGPVKVVSATSEQMFLDLTPAEVAKLPRYKGDLLLTGHSTGELTSEAFMKRSERKNEQLADAAERASVTADWLGSAAYPMDKINAAWNLVLGAQFHDTMAGTALPKSYEYSWNNEILALNQFAAVAQNAAGAVIRGMDTRGEGTSVVVYNPLTIEREDVAEATVVMPGDAGVSVFGPDGKQVPSQIVSKDGNKTKVLFLAKAPSVGFATYDFRPQTKAAVGSELKVTDHTLENNRFKVTINADGDIASVYDKSDSKETLAAPARLEMLYENPEAWPAWNMDYVDRMRAPRAVVTGPAKIRIIENGPARIAIEVERMCEGSKITQTIRLAPAKAGGDRVEIAACIDWQTKETSLEAVFPMTASNPLATYESQTAAVQRGNNTEKKFEVPQQQWFDLTASNGDFGAAILNDCKYGSDKPNDNTVRLTLLYTPGTRAGYEDQGSQDIGRHEMVYAIAPHAGNWEKGGVPFLAQRLNQPLLTFLTPAHEGTLGKTFSLCKISSDHVTAMAIKKAEDTDEIIIRLHEVDGQEAGNVRVKFAGRVLSAREVDGQEREIGKASLQDGSIETDLTPFAMRAFAVKLAPASEKFSPPVCEPLKLAYDLDAVSNHDKLDDGAFDSEGHTFAGENWPESITSEGIVFDMGSKTDGEKNALVCKGQTIPLPTGVKSLGAGKPQMPNRVYILAAAIDGDVPCTFKVDGTDHPLTVEDWTGYVGQWDNRLWQGVVPGLTYSWKNRLVGLTPGFSKPATVAWYLSHRHDPSRGNEYYKFTYLFKYAIDLPAGAKELTLPDNEKVRVFAITAAADANDESVTARPLYDTFADRADQKDDMPAIAPAGGKFTDTPTVTIQHPLYYTDKSLHYTTDGSEPTADSPVYTKPFLLPQSATVKAKEISESGVTGPTVSAQFEVNDTTPPKVVSAMAIAQSPTLSIRFSKPVKKEQAENNASYMLAPAVAVHSAVLNPEGTVVALTLDQPVSASAYQLTITGVTDLSANSNPVSASPVSVTVNKPVFTLDSFTANGEELDKKVPHLPGKAGDKWTINLFVKPSSKMDDRTVIAGFGHDEDSGNDGIGRYISKFASGVHFWARNADGEADAAFDTNRWQMITAVYDGKNLSLFKNGRLIGDGAVSLSNDSDSTVRIAPLDPWEHTRRFKGEIRDFTIWNAPLPVESLHGLLETMPK
jgi:alpha-mannosidase